MDEDFSGLTRLHRRFLQPITVGRFPDSPRPIAEETLWSYCLRLGRMFNSDVGTLLRALGIPPSVPFEALETLPCSVLSNRLAAATGRNISRFATMQCGPADDILKVGERTAFCPRCWLDRRCADAAYFARSWARSWVFFCPKHPGQLLHELAGGVCCTRLFGQRSYWTTLVEGTYPRVWLRACAGLDVDPMEEWAHANGWLRRLELDIGQVSPTHAPAPDTRVACDLANYLQIAWPAQSSEGIAPVHVPARVIDESDHCHGRMLVGSLEYRLRTLILVRHLLSVLSSPRATETGQGIAGRLQTKPHTEIDTWWLQRRLLHWPEALRRAGHAIFGLAEAAAYAIPPFDACRHCVEVADPPLKQRGLHFALNGDLHCLKDPWCKRD